MKPLLELSRHLRFLSINGQEWVILQVSELREHRETLLDFFHEFQMARSFLTKGCNAINAANLQFIPAFGRPPEPSLGDAPGGVIEMHLSF